MNTNSKNSTQLDSHCSRRVSTTDAPDAVAPRCKREAATWVISPKGSRRYVCEDHAREVLRFLDDEDAADLPEHPTVRPCADCGRYTLRENMDLSTGTCDACSPANGAQTTETTDTEEREAEADGG